MLNLKVSILFLVLSAAISSYSSDESVSRYFQSINKKVRIDIIKNSRTMKKVKTSKSSAELNEEDDKDNTLVPIDIVKYLNEKCGYEYKRDAKGSIIRPQAECIYIPRDTHEAFNGQSAKFDCRFKFEKNGETKIKTLKVKYDENKIDGGGYKEIPQAVIGTLMARLLGFYSTSYCPMDITCKGCPSANPWASHSQAEAIQDRLYEFKNVVVEFKPKGYKVEDKALIRIKPQGFTYSNELLSLYPQTTSPEEIQKLKIEREALAIWLNFTQSADADKHNGKVVCAKVDAQSLSDFAEGKNRKYPICLRSYVEVNDYGDALGFAGAKNKMNVNGFKGAPIRLKDQKFFTTGARGDAMASDIEVSVEAIQLFLKMAEAISDQQLEDIYQLAQIEKVSNGNIRSWIEAYRNKVKAMRDLLESK